MFSFVIPFYCGLWYFANLCQMAFYEIVLCADFGYQVGIGIGLPGFDYCVYDCCKFDVSTILLKIIFIEIVNTLS